MLRNSVMGWRANERTGPNKDRVLPLMVIDGQLRNCSAPDGHCIHKSDPLTQPAMAMTRKWYISVPWPSADLRTRPRLSPITLRWFSHPSSSSRFHAVTPSAHAHFTGVSLHASLESPPSTPTLSHYPKLSLLCGQRVRPPPQPFKKPCGNRNLRSPFFILLSVSLCPTNNFISIRPVRR